MQHFVDGLAKQGHAVFSMSLAFSTERVENSLKTALSLSTQTTLAMDLNGEHVSDVLPRVPWRHWCSSPHLGVGQHCAMGFASGQRGGRSEAVAAAPDSG